MSLIRRTDDDLYRSFDRFFGPGFFGPQLARVAERQGLTVSDWAPAVDVSEDDTSYRLHAELPSLTKEDVELTVEDGVLTLSGERRSETKEADPARKWHRVERSFGKFRRSFAIPDDVDATAIQASFKDGVLEVVLPKTTARPVGKRTVAIA